MPQKRFSSSHARERRHTGGKAHSFDMGYESVSSVDGELDHLFGEFWEGTQWSGILMARKNCKKLLADAGNVEPGDDLSAEDPADGA